MLAPRLFTENVFDDFFDDYGFDKAFRNIDRKLYGKHASREMLTDVREKDDRYELLIDLPGFKKENIKIALSDGYLTVTAEKGHEENETDDKGKLVRQERYSGTMQRSFYVGEEIGSEEVSAKFEGGVLMLDIPKKEERKELPAESRIMIE